REHTKLSEAEILTRVLDKLDAVGLRAAAHLGISEISGGMARRVALARAIVLEPELILYDEPFAGLDPISMGITAQLIRDLTDRLNCASVLITHDVQESFAITDLVCIVGQGQMLATGTPAELSASDNDYIQQFIQGKPDGPIAFHYPATPAFDAWLKQSAVLKRTLSPVCFPRSDAWSQPRSMAWVPSPGCCLPYSCAAALCTRAFAS